MRVRPPLVSRVLPALLLALTPLLSLAAPGGLARRDLAVEEKRGGHTLSRHVGKSDDELRDRLRREPDISAASTYTDQDTAERTVGQAVRDERTKVTSWEKSTSHPNLVLRVTMPSTVGRSIRQGSSAAKDVKSAVVVLKWSGQGWYVLTSYPEDR